MEEEISVLLKEFSALDEEINRLKNLRRGFEVRMTPVNKCDDDIMKLLSDEECENELAETLVRDDSLRLCLIDIDSILEKAIENRRTC